MDFKNGVKNIQTAGYNGARTYYRYYRFRILHQVWITGYAPACRVSMRMIGVPKNFLVCLLLQCGNINVTLLQELQVPCVVWGPPNLTWPRVPKKVNPALQSSIMYYIDMLWKQKWNDLLKGHFMIHSLIPQLVPKSLNFYTIRNLGLHYIWVHILLDFWQKYCPIFFSIGAFSTYVDLRRCVQSHCIDNALLRVGLFNRVAGRFFRNWCVGLRVFTKLGIKVAWRLQFLE